MIVSPSARSRTATSRPPLRRQCRAAQRAADPAGADLERVRRGADRIRGVQRRRQAPCWPRRCRPAGDRGRRVRRRPRRRAAAGACRPGSPRLASSSRSNWARIGVSMPAIWLSFIALSFDPVWPRSCGALGRHSLSFREHTRRPGVTSAGGRVRGGRTGLPATPPEPPGCAPARSRAGRVGCGSADRLHPQRPDGRRTVGYAEHHPVRSESRRRPRPRRLQASPPRQGRARPSRIPRDGRPESLPRWPTAITGEPPGPGVDEAAAHPADVPGRRPPGPRGGPRVASGRSRPARGSRQRACVGR